MPISSKSSNFLHGSDICKLWKIMLKFLVLSIALARLGTILHVLREINSITAIKAYNFRIKSGLCKRLLPYDHGHSGPLCNFISTSKPTNHLTEILLKEVINTLTLPPSWRGVLVTTLCDQVCQWLATGRWFSTGTLVSSTIKTDCHDITEILLKVALNTKNLNLNLIEILLKKVVNTLNLIYSTEKT